jgi:HK97 gp10 family phage protein
MANEITVNISGLDDLQKALEAIDDKLATKVIRDAVRAGGQEVKAEMVTMAPKDTGWESEHIDVKTSKVKGEARAVSAFIGPNGKVVRPRDGGKTQGLPRTASFLGLLQEFGSATRAKHPWLTASWEISKDRALDRIIDVLRERLGF